VRLLVVVQVLVRLLLLQVQVLLLLALLQAQVLLLLVLPLLWQVRATGERTSWGRPLLAPAVPLAAATLALRQYRRRPHRVSLPGRLSPTSMT